MRNVIIISLVIAVIALWSKVDTLSEIQKHQQETIETLEKERNQLVNEQTLLIYRED